MDYMYLDNSKMNWAGNVQLCENGFQYVWENPLGVQEKYFVNLFRQGLNRQFCAEMNGELRESRVMTGYRAIKSNLL